MNPIIGLISVDNPLCEEYAIDRAKHKFLMSNGILWLEWNKFMPDAEYAERSREFNKRIAILSTTPTVKVVDGWYRVTSVLFKMQYKGGNS
jgi:hypothetical protein